MKRVYVVELVAPIERLVKSFAHPDLPVIDDDVVVYKVLSLFGQPDAKNRLSTYIADLASQDYLFFYDEDNYFAEDYNDAREQQRKTICAMMLEFAEEVYMQLYDTGLLCTGQEQYKISKIPRNDETYLFTPVRH